MSTNHKIKNWQLPFSQSDSSTVDSATYLAALAKAGSGFYPLSVNHVWHGGIHLNEAVRAALNQQQGIGCLADGQVIAYRINKTAVLVDYTEVAKKETEPANKQHLTAHFSSGFTLVHHLLEMPVPRIAALPTDSATAASPIRLNLYSLYMHLMTAEDYSKNSALPQPAYWGHPTNYHVGDKASNLIPGCRLRQAGAGTKIVAILPRGTQVTVGEAIKPGSHWRKLITLTSGTTLPALNPLSGYLYTGEMTALATDYSHTQFIVSGSDVNKEIATGLNVRVKPNGQVLGVLPKGTQLSIGKKNGHWGQITAILAGQAYPAEKSEQQSVTNEKMIAGWIYLNELDELPSAPNIVDRVVLVDPPIPIKAGELIGYLGHEQTTGQAVNGLAPSPLLHLEVFTCDDLPSIMQRTSALARQDLDKSRQSLRVINSGTPLSTPSQPDTSVDSQIQLIPVDKKATGAWRQVTRQRELIVNRQHHLGTYDAKQKHYSLTELNKAAIATEFSLATRTLPDQVAFTGDFYGEWDNTHTTKQPIAGDSTYIRRKIRFTPVNMADPVWVASHQLNAAGQRDTLTGRLEAWSQFPLANRPADTLTVFPYLLSTASWQALPAEHKAEDTEKTAWFYLTTGDEQGRDMSGWVKDTAPEVTRHSPWEWPLFEAVKETATPQQLYERLNLAAKLDPLDQTPLMKKLLNIISADAPQAHLNPQQLSAALQRPWLAQQLSRLVTYYESEWYADEGLSKWHELDREIVERGGETSLHYWNIDKEQRIKPLLWWPELAGQHGIKADGKAWHFHPVGLVDSFMGEVTELITLEMLSAANPDGAKNHHKTILPYLNKYAKRYGLIAPKAIAHFLSQIGHESGFKILSEELSYRASQMKKIFGCAGGPSKYNFSTDECDTSKLRSKLWTEENRYAHNPQNLGNYVYANRMGNGDEASGDGFKYRGRGMIQITGKEAYRNFQNVHNRNNSDDIQDFVTNPDLVISSVEYGVESAFVFWTTKSGKPDSTSTTSIFLQTLAETGTIKQVTKLVNGGQNGYDDRKKRFNRIAPLLSIATEE